MARLLFATLIICTYLSFATSLFDLMRISEICKQKILTEHNNRRAMHGAPPLQWHSGLANVAQFWASTLAFKNAFFHSDLENIGENIYFTSDLNAGRSGAGAVDYWYNEIKDYEYSNPIFNFATSHFTQVVWGGTKHVGCGQASNGHELCVVCNYHPAGNMEGEFKQNVGKLIYK